MKLDLFLIPDGSLQISFWISFHFLTEKNFKNLSLFIEFIVGVCYPCWFQIKVKHSWLDGPRHVLFQLKQLKYQKEEAIAVVNKRLLEIKGKGDDNTQFGNNTVRCRKIPRINTDADNLMDLIEWKDSV